MVVVIFGGGLPGSGRRIVVVIVPEGCVCTSAVPGGGASACIAAGFTGFGAGFAAGGGGSGGGLAAGGDVGGALCVLVCGGFVAAGVWFGAVASAVTSSPFQL